MLRVNSIQIPVGSGEDVLRKRLCKELSVPQSALRTIQIVRSSIDARKKNDVRLVYCVNAEVEDEEAVLRRTASGNISRLEIPAYEFPVPPRKPEQPPVVVGMGPAGLFAALMLARNEIPCIVLERGRPVEERTADVEKFWSTGTLDPCSNVQFGEGGAGTFSDGKLTTGTHDPRNRIVLEILHEFGAPEDILYSHKPHIGSDVLRGVVRNIRQELERLGCTVLFEHRMTGLDLRDGAVCGITADHCGDPVAIPCSRVILAPGHSARDTFSMLAARGVPMEQKQFAIGVRIEHRQEDISRSQFGRWAPQLPPADYKLSCHLPSGRSAFTFCVCPGGQVVASASEQGRLVTNGMSLRARDGENINGGFLVGVGPADYPGTDPLAGVRFQEEWERKAWEIGKNFRAPAQLVGDFLNGKASREGGSIRPTYRPGVIWSDLRLCLPDYVTDTLRDALPLFDRKVHGFALPEAVLTGIETRSSSPVRVLRGEDGQSAIRGLYPCGEGCGYAGGIMSAAADGVRAAERAAQP